MILLSIQKEVFIYEINKSHTIQHMLKYGPLKKTLVFQYLIIFNINLDFFLAKMPKGASNCQKWLQKSQSGAKSAKVALKNFFSMFFQFWI